MGFRYIDSSRGDGTVVDLKTKLCWQKVASESRFTFWQAQNFAKDYSLSGGKWRVPTLDELRETVGGRVLTSAKNVVTYTDLFNCPPDWYWTSTLVAGDPTCAWYLNSEIYYPGLAPITRCFRVRLVREA